MTFQNFSVTGTDFMQVNPIGYHVRDRILSFFLALMMLISSVSFPEFSAFAEDEDNTGGFDLSISWNSDDTNDEKYNPSTIYKYYSEKDEERIVTLKVKYQNKDVSKYDYEPGKIIITVPGLKDAVRSETSYLPIAVAADEMSNTNKSHDWSYSYTQTTDTYTFINNKKIDAKSTFEGSFEIMWRLPSRSTKDAYKKDDLQGTLKAIACHDDDEEYYEAESEPISYEQNRKPDKYTIEEEPHFLYKDEIWSGDEPPIKDYDKYTWVKYIITGTDTYYARDVEGSERFDCYFLEDAIVQGAGLKKIEGKTRSDFGDDQTYQCWSVEKDITPKTSSTYLEGIYVAYPPKYKDKEVTNYVKLCGTYFDESTEEILAETDKTIDLSEYGFRDIPGPVYDVEKYSYGITNEYIKNHDKNCSDYGAINASHLSGNKQEYESSFKLELDFADFVGAPKDKDSIDLEYYDLEFVDDIMDISLNQTGEDGSNFRKLEDNEYHFTRIKIPSNQNIHNKNGLPIKADTYPVEIYFRRAGGKFSYNFLTDKVIPEPDIKDLKITSSEQMIEIPYDDVVGIKIVVRGVKESFYTSEIRCYYQFNITNEELSKIITSGGQLINNMYFNLYIQNSEGYKWFNDGFLREYYSNDREYNRDIELYGHGVDREKATLHILEIPSEFKIKSVTLQETQSTNYIFACNGSITSEFTLGDGADYSNFSMYTILPEDFQLFDNCSTPETLKEVLSFSDEGLSSAYISEHTTIEIIPNYKDSGRQYLAFHYDFDKPITSKTITVSGIPIYVNKDKIEEKSKSYTMFAGMLIDQQGKWFSTSKDNYLVEKDIWVDMDYDGNIEEPASFGNTTIEVKNPKQNHVELVKFVKTTKTVGYVNPGENEGVPMTYAGDTYSYRLRASVGEEFGVKNFIFFDAIETHEGKEWQGEFDHIDYSYAEKIFGAAPIIYYSTEVETFERDQNDNSYIIKPEAFENKNGEKWTTTKPNKVRSVAVYFGDKAFAKSNSIIYIDIIMKAPNATVALKEKYYDKVTVNDCAVGYDKVSNDAGQNVEHQNLPSNNVRVKFVHNMGKITLVKKDSVDNQTIITEAKFELYRKGDNNDTLIDTYTTQNGRIVVKDLLYGDYYFKEVDAPKGYERSEDILKVTLNGEEPDVSVTKDFKNERKKGEVTFKKVSDRDETCGLQGAEFAVYDSNDNLIKEKLTTDAKGELTITGLEWGSYYLKETKAPAGYEISEEITEFEVNADNDAGRDLELVIKNEQKPAYATLIKKESTENGGDGERRLAGAVYELYTSDDKLIGTYMTNDEGKIYAEDLTFGTYYFKETIAPKGYELNTEDITFTVGAEHTSKALEVPAYDKRKLGRVTLLKLDDEEQPVKDAIYGLFKDGEKINELPTTEEGYIELNNLWWGDYYFKELKAPKGYELDETQHKFSINENTVSKRIVLNVEDKRQKGEVKLVKYNESDKPLEGAVYTLYRNDGSVYHDNLKTDANGTISVKDILWGSYYFLEKDAPNGYGLSSEKIRFSVNYLTAGKIQELSAIDSDEITYKLTVVKKIKIEDIVFSHGNPTFTFKVAGKNGETYHQAVTFSEEYLNEYQLKNPDAEYIEASVIFTGLGGAEYTVTEIETNRYETSEVTAENGTVNADNSVVFDINSTDKDYQATFTNGKTTQKGLSHSSQISNILKRSRKYTALVVEWTGADTITTNQLDRDLLNVWAVYDDGAQEKLANDAYALNPANFNDYMGGEYTVTVSYVEAGITRSDSFNVTISGESPFKWSYKDGKEEAFTDDDGKKYDGKAIIYEYTGSAKTLMIPKSVTKDGKKYKVVGVAGSGGNKSMTGIGDCDTLILPEGLETIAEYTFKNCTKLSGDLVIPDSVITIETEAFGDCQNLDGTLTMSKNVKTIGDTAFARCYKLKGGLDLTNVTSLGSYVFVSCNSLDGELKLPQNSDVTEIKVNTFYDCKNLKGTLEIPPNIEKISYGAFYNCQGFTELNLHEGLKEISVSINNESFQGKGAFHDCTGLKGDLKIPDTVTKIGDYAFYQCGFNGKLTLGNNVTTIGENAFQLVNFTGSLEIPDSVTTIKQSAFAVSGFDELTFGIDSKLKSIERFAFNGCGFTGSLTIPSTVTTIGESAFKNCKGFKGYTLTIPKNNSLTEIGASAFYNCHFDYVYGKGIDSIQSRVWIPINTNNESDIAKMAEYGYSLDTVYLYNSLPNTNAQATKEAGTSELTMGNDPFWGYQLPYAFFERNS